MKTPNLLALSAAVLITAAGLASMGHSVTRIPVAEIDGLRVIDLAPVQVTPSAEDLRSAALTAVTTNTGSRLAFRQARCWRIRVTIASEESGSPPTPPTAFLKRVIRHECSSRRRRSCRIISARASDAATRPVPTSSSK